MITIDILDDNADDNGMSGYERLKRWREAHRSLVNLRQQEYRRGLVSGKKESSEQTRIETDKPQRTTVEKLRELIAHESAKPPGVTPTKPQIFKDDYGRIINERQWNTLQERKNTAKEGGYVIDEYSQ